MDRLVERAAPSLSGHFGRRYGSPMPLPYDEVHLIADPLYRYVRITVGGGSGEVTEADIIDRPWVQRLKRIHQLQSAWWVFPTAEHSRFVHSLGTMHLAGELARQVYPTLREVAGDTPSMPLVEETLRLAGLLHDVGHGPFSHFFDEEVLHPRYGLDHEQLSQLVIVEELGDAIAALRRSPGGCFASDEAVDPRHVAHLIRAASGGGSEEQTPPRWVELLHRALSGAVTVDNMDYVRRDAFMCGVSAGPVDVDRLLYYTFCTDEGLTFHKRALSSLRAFLNARFYMYENVYFHRISRAIDLHLMEIFPETMALLLPDDPRVDRQSYQRLTEWWLFDAVERWLEEPAGSEQRRLAEEWRAIIHRDVKYRMVFEQSVERQQPLPAMRDLTREEFGAGIRRALPTALADLVFAVDIASQDPRPLNPMTGPKRLPVYDPATGRVADELLGGILEFVPAKAHLYRVFATDHAHDRELSQAARAVLTQVGEASLTNL
jgi:HD superfamily phosphohydrolase